ncbi:hypothetical protein [Embleya sp. NPDC020630]|uniref:hypothetical protein n=1 Tax=Embleya sp. NPDC020630 TaxID=3363979 RepID=UPI003793805C
MVIRFKSDDAPDIVDDQAPGSFGASTSTRSAASVRFVRWAAGRVNAVSNAARNRRRAGSPALARPGTRCTATRLDSRRNARPTATIDTT